MTDTVRRYVIYTYLSFWCAVALVAAGFLASGQNMAVLNWGGTISSWVPTFVLLLLFKTLLPGTTPKQWLKQAFAPRINLGLLATVTAVMIAGMAAASGLTALGIGQPIANLFSFSLPAFATGLGFAIIQGATGEEAGWRGYLQPLLERRSGVVKGSLLVGLIWAFWHTPLWFASAPIGWPLLIYIAAFIIGTLALSVIMGVAYSHCRNLAVPMWIHFVSNLMAVPYKGDPLTVRCWLALFYVLAAVGFATWHRSRRRPAIANEKAS